MAKSKKKPAAKKPAPKKSAPRKPAKKPAAKKPAAKKPAAKKPAAKKPAAKKPATKKPAPTKQRGGRAVQKLPPPPPPLAPEQVLGGRDAVHVELGAKLAAMRGDEMQERAAIASAIDTFMQLAIAEGLPTDASAYTAQC